jgi:hypothetical protein
MSVAVKAADFCFLPPQYPTHFQPFGEASVKNQSSKIKMDEKINDMTDISPLNRDLQQETVFYQLHNTNFNKSKTWRI